MVKLAHKSKRQKLSTKYNIQKRVREHKRRVRKEARKHGIKKIKRKDPGIPNTFPFKAELLAQLEQKKAKRDEEIMKQRTEAKRKAKSEANKSQKDRQEELRERDEARREKRSKELERQRRDALRKVFGQADMLLEVLDARDPLGCRSAEAEAWAQENGRRLVFVIAKADLVAPDLLARWMQLLGQVGPVVAVSAEAGREGVRELIQMLGHASSADAAVTAAPSAVAVLGYPGTGKRALCKAIRQEARSAGGAGWLLEAVGRLRQSSKTPQQPTGAEALNSMVRGLLNRFGEGAPPEHVPVVSALIERAGKTALMRRFRLPAFDNAEGFLRAFAKDKNLKNKKGKDPNLEFIAREVIGGLPKLPGCCFSPPDSLTGSQPQLWAAHSASRQRLAAAMEAQVAALKARPAGPAGGALMIASGGMGPTIGLAAFLAAPVSDSDAEENDDDEAMDMDDGEGDEEEEEDDDDMEDMEEEDFEGEEEEEDDMEDDDEDD
eukprot:gnl/TRDRNA2_/TRDRNA2_35397_c0_seq1.p1 gnl/TRDRNA2_/TRDRNA2_35397_c0~~gnl/TRDRNA2_/TRDRNA2_35397_c0_seq1.p1  ORF type:complete len:493 (+),score=131.37 gnl/TRDRNA2_/TRDRNA2_35397_c0_seq1:50-1528(+)